MLVLRKVGAILIAVCAVIVGSGCGATNAWVEADGLFKSKKFQEAAEAYAAAAEEYPERPELIFNAGTAQFMAKEYSDARRSFQTTAREASGELKEKAEFNTGNTYMAEKKPEEAIEHYKRALYLKPDDVNAKWNLEMARQKHQQQQSQQQQQQDDSTQEQDENQQDDKEQTEQDQQPKDDQEQQNRQNQDEQQQEQSPEQQRMQEREDVSREQAERLLRALAEEDKELQKQLRTPKYRERTAPGGKDW